MQAMRLRGWGKAGCCAGERGIAPARGLAIGDAMEWRDKGVLLAMRRYGESAAIIEVLTETRGRHAGVVRGGGGRRMAPVLQPGAQLDLTWRARLEDHLGSFTVEPLRLRAADAMADRLALLGLGSVCALLRFALPERAPQAVLYPASCALLDRLGQDGWLRRYLVWELQLLEETGYGLDLSRCVVTGATEGLAYVSPRTGRAVSAAGAGSWAERLLPLPRGMDGQDKMDRDGLLAGLRLTGHFLQGRLAPALGDRPLPEARARFLRAVER